jgi:hypothetical protein
MRLCAAMVAFLSLFPSWSWAEDGTDEEEKASMSLALGGLRIGRVKEINKPKAGVSESKVVTSVDLFGVGGDSSLPYMEFGLSVGKFVFYGYPNEPIGGRELWVGMKTSDATEVGFIAGINQLTFNPAEKIDDKETKAVATNRLGLFVNHRMQIDEESVDLNVSPWYAFANSRYSDSTLNESSHELGLSAEVLWVWKIAENLEAGSGAGFAWSRTDRSLNGKVLQTIDWSNLSVILAETTYSF